MKLRTMLWVATLSAPALLGIGLEADAQPATPKRPPIGPAKPNPDAPKPDLGKPERPKLVRPIRPLKVAPPLPRQDKGDGKPDGKKDDKDKPAPVTRWTEATPEKMVPLALARARAGKEDALAGALVAVALSDRTPFGEVGAGLTSVTGSTDAPMLAQLLASPAAVRAWDGWQKARFDASPNRQGLVQSFAIVGPFQDTGGGLARREGPEANPRGFSDATASYSWGVYEVGVRRTLPESATARGLPLDLYIEPRQETCTYLASAITLPADPKGGDVKVWVASTGAVRLSWDGQDVASSDEVHRSAIVDRLGASIQPDTQPHVLSLKVCSAAQADEGRARVRFTDGEGKPLAVTSSSIIAGSPAPAADTPAPKAPKKKTAAKIARFKTPFEIAIDAGATPSKDKALAAAIVRTLAGADDLRSPRAPGLLDRVAREASVTPDELAMSGWLSSFGANKSGWLNQARERAQKANDTATNAFAQRRLAEAQIRTSRLDWALQTLKDAPFAGATDVEAAVIRSDLKVTLGPSAQVGVLDDLLVLDKRSRGRAPNMVLRRIRNVASTRPEVVKDVVRRLASRGEITDASLALTFGIDGAKAVEKSASDTLLRLSDARSLTAIGRELLVRDRAPWAREIFYTASKLSPNNADAFSGLAAARRAHAVDTEVGKAPTDDYANAAKAERRALALRPTDTRAKAEAMFRAGISTTDDKARTPSPDEAYLAASKTIVDRANQNPAKVGEVFDRQLHFMRVVTYHPDKRVSQLIHFAREIVVEPRTQEDLFEREIPSEGDSSELLFARVLRKDGSVAEPEEQSSGGAQPFIKWPRLERGDVVEVAVRSWTGGPVGRRGDPPFYFIDYVGSTETRPILYNEVVVDSEAASPLGVDVVGGKPDRLDEKVTEAGRKITRYIWDKPQSLPDEPLAPRSTETLPLVLGSTYRSWDEFREWYRGATLGFSEPDDQVRRLAAELTKGKKSQAEKIEALFNFVADDIRYVNYVSGEWWLPNRPQQCLARRQGDCDDKAMLLISLLKAVGVDATPVLVQTRLTGMPRVLSSTKAAVPLFDHGIAFIPGKGPGGKGQWLDATSPQSRIGPLPSMDARARALFIRDGEAKILDTPPSAPADHGVETEWTVKLASTGAADIVGKEKHLGDWAFFLRNNLVEPDARAQWVEQYLSSRWLNTVDLSGDIAYAPNQGTLGYTAHSEGFARREGDELSIPLVGAYVFTSALAPLKTRTLPLSLPPDLAPSHQLRKLTIEAPPEFAFSELPPGGEIKAGELGHARVSFQPGPKPSTIVVEIEIVFDKSIIPVAEYPAFRTFLQGIDRLLHHTVRLAPRVGGDPGAKPGTQAVKPIPQGPAAPKAPAQPNSPTPTRPPSKTPTTGAPKP